MHFQYQRNHIFYQRQEMHSCTYKIQSLAGRSLLSRALKEVYGLKIEVEEFEHEISVTDQGKPYLKNYTEIHFNISHCDDWVACIVSDAPVGIDAEQTGNYCKGMERKILTQSELTALSAVEEDEEMYKRQFFRFWTLKEAYLKYKGSGFWENPKDVEFYLNVHETEGEVQCSDPAVQCIQIPLEGDGYLAAVVSC